MAKSYSEKLLDRRWQKRRLEELERAGWICEWCHIDDQSTLHVHHWVYAKNPWDAPEGTLSVLCETCHGKADRIRVAAFNLLGLLLANPDAELSDAEAIDDFVFRFEEAVRARDTSGFVKSILWWFDGAGFWRDRSEEEELICEIGIASMKLCKVRSQAEGRTYGVSFRSLESEEVKAS